MVTIISGAQPVTRDALGHADQTVWERDSEGRPRDPWQKTTEIPAREVSGNKREVVIVGSSKGWEGACKALFQAFLDGGKLNHGKIPIIELRGDKYNHPKWGLTKTPVMTLVEWQAPEALLAKPTTKTKF